MDRRHLGNTAEDRALEFLASRGLTLVRRNFNCRAGELDLVMMEGGTLAIVEVRAREDRGFGSAADSIGPRKQQRIIRAAHFLLLKNPPLRRLPVRFDVVTLDRTGGQPRIEWIRGAFNAG